MDFLDYYYLVCQHDVLIGKIYILVLIMLIGYSDLLDLYSGVEYTAML